MACRACLCGDGPWSLHHWEDEGCQGSFGGARFRVEKTDNDSLRVVRVEPVPTSDDALLAGRRREEQGNVQ